MYSCWCYVCVHLFVWCLPVEFYIMQRRLFNNIDISLVHAVTFLVHAHYSSRSIPANQTIWKHEKRITELLICDHYLLFTIFCKLLHVRIIFSLNEETSTINNCWCCCVKICLAFGIDCSPFKYCREERTTATLPIITGESTPTGYLLVTIYSYQPNDMKHQEELLLCVFL